MRAPSAPSLATLATLAALAALAVAEAQQTTPVWQEIVVNDCADGAHFLASSPFATHVSTAPIQSVLRTALNELLDRAQCFSTPRGNTRQELLAHEAELLRRYAVLSPDMIIGELTRTFEQKERDALRPGRNSTWRDFFDDVYHSDRRHTWQQSFKPLWERVGLGDFSGVGSLVRWREWARLTLADVVPSTCTWEEYRQGRACRFEVDLTQYAGIALQAVVKKCPNSAVSATGSHTGPVLPFISLTCRGEMCSRLAMPCNSDAECGANGHCSSTDLTPSNVMDFLKGVGLMNGDNMVESIQMDSLLGNLSQCAVDAAYSSSIFPWRLVQKFSTYLRDWFGVGVPMTSPQFKICVPKASWFNSLSDTISSDVDDFKDRFEKTTSNMMETESFRNCAARGCDPLSQVADGVCDSRCDNEDCRWDGGDCSGPSKYLTFRPTDASQIAAMGPRMPQPFSGGSGSATSFSGYSPYYNTGGYYNTEDPEEPPARLNSTQAAGICVGRRPNPSNSASDYVPSTYYWYDKRRDASSCLGQRSSCRDTFDQGKTGSMTASDFFCSRHTSESGCAGDSSRCTWLNRASTCGRGNVDVTLQGSSRRVPCFYETRNETDSTATLRRYYDSTDRKTVPSCLRTMETRYRYSDSDICSAPAYRQPVCGDGRCDKVSVRLCRKPFCSPEALQTGNDAVRKMLPIMANVSEVDICPEDCAGTPASCNPSGDVCDSAGIWISQLKYRNSQSSGDYSSPTIYPSHINEVHIRVKAGAVNPIKSWDGNLPDGQPADRTDRVYGRTFDGVKLDRIPTGDANGAVLFAHTCDGTFALNFGNGVIGAAKMPGLRRHGEKIMSLLYDVQSCRHAVRQFAPLTVNYFRSRWNPLQLDPWMQRLTSFAGGRRPTPDQTSSDVDFKAFGLMSPWGFGDETQAEARDRMRMVMPSSCDWNSVRQQGSCKVRFDGLGMLLNGANDRSSESMLFETAKCSQTPQWMPALAMAVVGPKLASMAGHLQFCESDAACAANMECTDMESLTNLDEVLVDSPIKYTNQMGLETEIPGTILYPPYSDPIAMVVHGWRMGGEGGSDKAECGGRPRGLQKMARRALEDLQDAPADGSSSLKLCVPETLRDTDTMLDNAKKFMPEVLCDDDDSEPCRTYKQNPLISSDDRLKTFQVRGLVPTTESALRYGLEAYTPRSDGNYDVAADEGKTWVSFSLTLPAASVSIACANPAAVRRSVVQHLKQKNPTFWSYLTPRMVVLSCSGIDNAPGRRRRLLSAPAVEISVQAPEAQASTAIAQLTTATSDASAAAEFSNTFAANGIPEISFTADAVSVSSSHSSTATTSGNTVPCISNCDSDTPDVQEEESGDDNSAMLGAIIGGVVGGLFLITGAAAAFFIVSRKQKSRPPPAAAAGKPSVEMPDLNDVPNPLNAISAGPNFMVAAAPAPAMAPAGVFVTAVPVQDPMRAPVPVPVPVPVPAKAASVVLAAPSNPGPPPGPPPPPTGQQWTRHFDTSSGAWYLYNARTGETKWQ